MGEDRKSPDSVPPLDVTSSRSILSRLIPISVLGYDVIASALAMFLSVAIRYEFEVTSSPPGSVEWVATGLFAAVCLPVFWILGLHRGLWRHTAINDIGRVFRAVIVAHLIFLPIFFVITRLDDFPRSSLFISIPLVMMILLMPRYCVAAWRSGDVRALFRIDNRSAPVAVLVGEEARVVQVLRDHQRRERGAVFRFRAIVETSGTVHGRALLGVPIVGSLDVLENTVRQASNGSQDNVRIVLADTDPSSDLVNYCARVAGRTGARLTRARTGEGASAFTQVEAADLLSRPPRNLAGTGARLLLSGKRVLVTGAGGTIGSELVRQASQYGPSHLILVDSSESNLYEIDMYLQSADIADLTWSSILADVRNSNAMDTVFTSENPEVVLHSAALKHVPLMESNAVEAVRTNVFGTISLVEAAIRHGSESLVMISTDKAVDATSIMGATKRCAEIYMTARAESVESTKLSCVRFGNVLASTGSVVPLFERQIEAGGPVTVTHPETTRYFMTLQEAASLVLEAGAQSAAGRSEQGTLFVLDMGDPIPIARLARQLIRLRGKEPERDIPVQFVGLRPGEKLHEALTHGFETLAPSTTGGVMTVSGHIADMGIVQAEMEQLREATETRDPKLVRAALDRMVSLGEPERIASFRERLSAAD